ncbi:MAG: tRNA (guanosine(37)-N1)-methyltransferase TrmD [Desulfobacter sp.]|nr:MAG: tRNA (guanosine(37)-N1)-methyltransferase TrmD [Desulfobacter sp.]
MEFTVLTLFPEFLEAFFANGIIGRAIESGAIQGKAVNIRDFSTNKHNNVDDRPYGGGSGMVMQPAPLEAAIESARQGSPGAKVICMSPQGQPFSQAKACELAGENQGLIFICGRYEGIDERVYARLVDEEISMGDFVMTGGEVAAMAMIDATARMLPGVLGSDMSSQSDSFMDHRLEHAQYTRPEVYKEMAVPGVLLSGNHEKIRQWRRRSALQRTFMKRPDLFDIHKPDNEEKAILRQWCRELEGIING